MNVFNISSYYLYFKEKSILNKMFYLKYTKFFHSNIQRK